MMHTKCRKFYLYFEVRFWLVGFKGKKLTRNNNWFYIFIKIGTNSNKICRAYTFFTNIQTHSIHYKIYDITKSHEVPNPSCMSLSSFICNSPRSFYDTAYSNNHTKIYFSKQIELYRVHTFLPFKFHIKYIVLRCMTKTSLHDKRKWWRWPDHLRYIIFWFKIILATKRFLFSFMQEAIRPSGM